MLKKIVIAVAVLVALFVAFVATRPATFEVQRSATMSAPADVVFEQVNDFRAWAAWSPWDSRDPQMKKSYEGPQTGPGAIYSWAGNKDVGEGRMTNVAAKPGEHVEIKLEFLKPFAATNKTTFTFKPTGSDTAVTWAMSGEHSFMGKAMSVFMDMDKMVGTDFEAGLANMKKLAEAEAQKRTQNANAAAVPTEQVQ